MRNVLLIIALVCVLISAAIKVLLLLARSREGK